MRTTPQIGVMVLLLVLFSPNNGRASGQCAGPELTAADAAEFDRFGYSVAADGDVLIVGSLLADHAGLNSGAAYVYQRQPDGQWQQIDILIGDDTAAGDHFGVSTAIRGDLIIIGADLADHAFADAGAAYIFRFVDGQWVQEQKLVADDAGENDKFGTSVALDGDFIFVGSPDDDDLGSNAGAAYVYHQSGGQWQQLQMLTASDGAAVDKFGRSLAIEGETALIAANLDDDAGTNAGAVYPFQYDGEQWVELPGSKIIPADVLPGDQFGSSIAMSNGLAVIGAAFNDQAAVNSGAAYIFQDKGGFWEQQQKLTLGQASAGDQFGYACGLNNDVIIVGAPFHGAGGAAAVFQFDSSAEQWVEIVMVAAPSNDTAAEFGSAVTVSDNRGFVGAAMSDVAGTNAGAVRIIHGINDSDCDDDGTPDACEIDEDGNGVPDDCETDCNDNGVPDHIDIKQGTAEDCNGNGVPDECDIDADPSVDCNDNGSIDVCEIAEGVVDDCNNNNVPDSCDIDQGTSSDSNGNGIPDECDVDCNDNGTPDFLDIENGTSEDCNENGIPDECDIAEGTSEDVDENGIPDECEDCNGNGILDSQDIADGTSTDINNNGIPDECEDCNQNDIPDPIELQFNPSLDCNQNGMIDACEINAGTPGGDYFCEEDCDPDCNNNGIPDSCDIAEGESTDCDANGVPDECDPDCNDNGVPDACDIAAGDSLDQNGNGIPDECEDCNENGTPDSVDISTGTSADCNENGIPDECEIPVDSPGGPYYCEENCAEDCNENGVPDECDLADGTSVDLNSNGIPDECEPDCNDNFFPDFLDIQFGLSEDVNGNGIPDECEPDLNGDGVVDVNDLLMLLAAWGECAKPCPPSCLGDLGTAYHPQDCTVGAGDLLILLSAWGM